MNIKCNWKHAVNTPYHLKNILNNNKYNCIEVDISWNPISQVPVILHSPISLKPLKSEYLFTSFLEIIKNSKFYSNPQLKIIKFDFKNINSVEKSIKLIKSSGLHQKINIWLNADILIGPGYSPLFPLNPMKFIDNCQQLKETTLSLGWSTNYLYRNEFSQQYSREMVDKMIDLTSNLNYNITYPVRASLVKNSWTELNRLVSYNSTYSRTITVWTGYEGVPQSDLNWMHDKEITYYDIENGPKYEWNTFSRFIFYVRIYEFVLVLFLIFVLCKIRYR